MGSSHSRPQGPPSRWTGFLLEFRFLCHHGLLRAEPGGKKEKKSQIYVTQLMMLNGYKTKTWRERETDLSLQRILSPFA